MKHLVCFVAGPYSSKYGWPGRVFNVIKMAIYVRRILKMGIMPVGPNVMYFLFSGCQPYEFWLSGTRSVQEKCDASFFIPGWEESGGAVAEYFHATYIKQPNFTSLLLLKDFSEKSFDCQNTESVS